jgi:hypothetical protein
LKAPEGDLSAVIPEVIISASQGEKVYQAIKDGNAQVKIFEANQEESALYTHANLYMSGADGASYTLALKDVVYVDSADWRNPSYVSFMFVRL